MRSLCLVLIAIAIEDSTPLPRLEVGKPVQGTIAESDPEVETPALKQRSDCGTVRGRSFRIEIERAGAYHVEVRSACFDTYLVVRNPDGEVVAEDDDGRVLSDSRIEFSNVAAGSKYRLDVCALRGCSGEFEVVLKEGLPPAPTQAEWLAFEISELRERLRSIEALRGPEHPDVARCFGLLGVRLCQQGQNAEAQLSIERALAINEKVLGPEHPQTAANLVTLADFLLSQGNRTAARPLYERALAIQEKVLGPEHPETAHSLSGLASLFESEGSYDLARSLEARALAIVDKVLGPGHPVTAFSLNKMGRLLELQGNFAAARPIYERALAIREKVFGPEHPDTAETLNNLASLFWWQGNYDAARPLYERALAISEKVLGPEHPNTAMSLTNLALLLHSQGNYGAARPLLERALAIREKVLGPEHSDTAAGLNNLALLLHSQGNLDEARPLFERALAIRERTLGPEHPETAAGLYNLAGLLRSRGDYAAARPLYERALAIREKTLGREHPRSSLTRLNLAYLLEDMADWDGAFSACESALASVEESSRLHFLALGESERLSYLALLRPFLDEYLHLTWQRPERAGAAYGRILFWKGRVSRSLASSRSDLDARAPAEARKVFSDLREAQTRLSNLLSMRNVRNREAHERQLSDVRQLRERLEREALRLLPDSPDERSVSVDDLRRALPRDMVFVDFLVHRDYEPAEWKDETLVKPGRSTEDRVTAFVLAPGRDGPARVELGPAAAMESAVRAFLEELKVTRGLAGAIQSTDGSATPANDALRSLVYDPLRAFIQEAPLVAVSPDRFLGTLPLETIKLEDGSYLLEHHSFLYVQDASSLATLTTNPASSMPSLLVAGGIDYEGRAEPAAAGEGAIAPLRSSFQAYWDPLLWTGREAQAIAGYHQSEFGAEGKRLLLEKTAATEERIKAELPRHSHVHLATHGYFQPEGLPSMWKEALKNAKQAEGRAPGMFEEAKRLTGMLPGLLSGLVFAGANEKAPEGRDDGLLTAEEVSWLDLSRCELVVLSACETALGRAEAGEGMLGLRRAFRQAGARTVISSLWRVNDESTSELMRSFYRNLWRGGMGKLEALRAAQLEMLMANRAKYRGDGVPYMWGAFVLDGDWR